VAINLKNIEELKKWLQYSFNEKKVYRVVIQEQIFWEDHRIIVINWKVEAVTKRIAPFIIWDWKTTIKKLIDIENENPLRWWEKNYDAVMSKIKIDSELNNYIKEQWYSMNSILEEKMKIKVRKNENLSTGWLAIDMTNKIHPEIKQEAIKIAKIAWLWFVWVDFLCEDISLSLKEGKWAIIEINATPWIRMHHFPSIWQSRNIAKKILEAIF
jgi:cyanophycin synthetase